MGIGDTAEEGAYLCIAGAHVSFRHFPAHSGPTRDLYATCACLVKLGVKLGAKLGAGLALVITKNSQTAKASKLSLGNRNTALWATRQTQIR